MSAIRPPAVSGLFYPSGADDLRQLVQRFLAEAAGPRRAVPAVIAPHAGYRYSGPTAAAAFAAVAVPHACVVVAPNHTGRLRARSGGSVLLATSYATPLGTVLADAALGDALLRAAGTLLEEDAAAHEREHAVEVVLPFIQVCAPHARIVPIVLAWSDWARTEQLAAAIVDVVGDRTDVLVIASSDMNHYESAPVTEGKDAIALERIVALDGAGLLDATRAHAITMCGRVPAACACEVARRRAGAGARGEVIAHTHSGVESGDFTRVVGYAGVLLGVMEHAA